MPPLPNETCPTANPSSGAHAASQKRSPESHRGTQFKPLHWKVSGTRKDGGAQTLYSICACKYTSDPPFCDATHTSLPLKYLKQIKECTAAEGHTAVEKICELCGFVPGVLDDSEGDEEPTDTQ